MPDLYRGLYAWLVGWEIVILHLLPTDGYPVQDLLHSTRATPDQNQVL